MVLTSADPLDENSLENPTKVAPKTSQITLSGSSFPHSFPAHSVTVLRITAPAAP
jgi:alpha-L-arabinofuranosidase